MDRCCARCCHSMPRGEDCAMGEGCSGACCQFFVKDHCSGKEASVPRRTTWAWTFVMSCEGGTGNRVMGLIGRLADSERAAKTKGGLAGRPENSDTSLPEFISLR